ncbi:MAG: PAS domain-containing protein [Methermicoccaceae archaeon]
MPVNGYSSTTIRTPVYEMLKKIAKERGVSVSDVIEEAAMGLVERAPEIEDIDSVSVEMHHLIQTTQKMQERAIRRVERIIEEFRRAQEKYKTLVETIPNLVFSTDPSGNFTYVNPMVYEYFGKHPNEVIGKNITNFVHEDDVDTMKAMFERLSNGRRVDEEYRFIDENNNTKYLHLYITPIMIKGKVVEAVGVASDVTEHRKVEEKIAYLKQFNESIVQNAPLGIITFDKEGNVTSFNKVFLKQLLCTPEELMNRNVFRDSIDERMESWYRKCLNGNMCEYRGPCTITTGGITRYYHKWFAPLKVDGKVVGGICIVEDITEQKKMEEKLQRQAKQSRAEQEGS